MSLRRLGQGQQHLARAAQVHAVRPAKREQRRPVRRVGGEAFQHRQRRRGLDGLRGAGRQVGHEARRVVARVDRDRRPPRAVRGGDESVEVRRRLRDPVGRDLQRRPRPVAVPQPVGQLAVGQERPRQTGGDAQLVVLQLLPLHPRPPAQHDHGPRAHRERVPPVQPRVRLDHRDVPEHALRRRLGGRGAAAVDEVAGDAADRRGVQADLGGPEREDLGRGAVDGQRGRAGGGDEQVVAVPADLHAIVKGVERRRDVVGGGGVARRADGAGRVLREGGEVPAEGVGIGRRARRVVRLPGDGGGCEQRDDQHRQGGESAGGGTGDRVRLCQRLLREPAGPDGRGRGLKVVPPSSRTASQRVRPPAAAASGRGPRQRLPERR